MSKLTFFIIGLCFFALQAYAQVSLERQVLSPTGAFGSGSYTLSYTIGQPEYTTGTGSDFVLTQGFQQPGFKDELIVELQVENANCSNDQSGSIDLISIAGCGSDNFALSLDGAELSFPILNLEPGEYELNIESGFNCNYSESIIIALDEGFCDLQFYNLISPDGDGSNEFWVIEHIDKYNQGRNEVQIVNRWGNTVFEAKNYNNLDVVWKGEDEDGQSLPIGTYFYRVLIAEQEYTGFIELLR